MVAWQATDYAKLLNCTGHDAALPAWVEMWGLAVAVYAICKLVTLSSVDRSAVSFGRSAGYLVAWPGMDARRFLLGSAPSGDECPDREEWLGALSKLLFGSMVLWGATRYIPPAMPLLRAWAGMTGIIFVLHFGGFHLLSCLCRSLGVQAEPLMHCPVAATSVTEFWGRRWNRAFRDLTHQFLFRPLVARLGVLTALWFSFLASGLVHDLVISVPARGGFGKPTLFFLIQPAAIGLERSNFGQRIGLGRGIQGWLFTAAVLILPLPLLFHAEFIRNVMLPFLRAIGATSS
jgi:hypothetical protein